MRLEVCAHIPWICPPPHTFRKLSLASLRFLLKGSLVNVTSHGL